MVRNLLSADSRVWGPCSNLSLGLGGLLREAVRGRGKEMRPAAWEGLQRELDFGLFFSGELLMTIPVQQTINGSARNLPPNEIIDDWAEPFFFFFLYSEGCSYLCISYTAEGGYLKSLRFLGQSDFTFLTELCDLVCIWTTFPTLCFFWCSLPSCQAWKGHFSSGLSNFAAWFLWKTLPFPAKLVLFKHLRTISAIVLLLTLCDAAAPAAALEC